MNPAPDIRIVPATERDTPLILTLIKGLAEYERLAHEVEATEDDIRESLFGDWPGAEVVLARDARPRFGYAMGLAITPDDAG